jgi:hypothetical protein
VPFVLFPLLDYGGVVPVGFGVDLGFAARTLPGLALPECVLLPDFPAPSLGVACAGEGASGAGAGCSGSVPGATGVSGDPGVGGASADGGVMGAAGFLGVAGLCASATPVARTATNIRGTERGGFMVHLTTE